MINVWLAEIYTVIYYCNDLHRISGGTSWCVVILEHDDSEEKYTLFCS